MLKPAMIFTDKMVLQREKEVPVWGMAEPGKVICVSFDGESVETTADEKGNWMAALPPHEAGVGYEMKISDGEEEICLKDVAVGEVWLAGGQSNMEFWLGFEAHYEELLEQEMNPYVRFFDYPQVSYEGQLEDFSYTQEGFWRGCSKEDLAHFSAVGYYFAQNVQKALGIPVGIVGCNWGGTPACAWMDPQRLIGTDSEYWVRDYEEAVKDLDVEAYKKAFVKNPANDRTNMLQDPFCLILVKKEMPREEQLKYMERTANDAPVVIGPYYEHRPGGLYETMLKKIHPYAIRGAIWYQGETDSDKHAEVYRHTFARLIENWRDLWKEEIPFLFVQLAPFGNWLGCEGVRYPVLRDAQEKVSKEVPNTWMASIGDAGMRWDIHPKDKKPVGERLAFLARGHVYGEDLLCDAPEFAEAVRCEGGIEISFKYADGLYLKGDQLQAMIGITAAGECCVLEEAQIREDKIFLAVSEDIVELQFAYTDYYEVNLYNKAGIPLKPFTFRLNS